MYVYAHHERATTHPLTTTPFEKSTTTGTRLHEVRRIAPEFYMDMPHYYSWAKVIWDFVTDPAVTPFKCERLVVLLFCFFFGCVCVYVAVLCVSKHPSIPFLLMPQRNG